jgi:uncharacterized protein YkwD
MIGEMSTGLLLVILAFTANPVASGAPERPRCPPPVAMPRSWPGEWEALEGDLAAVINRVRERGVTCRGVRQPPVRRLNVHESLREAARRQTHYMAVRGVWGHDVGGCDVSTWIDSRRYPWKSLGQNLARRRGRNSAARVVERWIASREGHCETLMSPKWRSIGIAYSRDGPEHLWTVDFGDR